MSENNIKYQLIGNISQKLGISPRTIRYYEELGLIVPRRSDGGFREYSDLEVEKLHTILRLKKLNLSLEEIQQLIRLRQCVGEKGSVRELFKQLHRRLHEFEEKVNEYKEGIEEINAMINIIDSCSDCKKEVEVIGCSKCLEEQNKEMPSLMKAML